MNERRRKKRLEGHMGVWNPAGGEPRPGSGLPFDEGREEIRVLRLSTEGQVRHISPNELEDALGYPASVVWVDILRPHEGSEALLRDTLRLGPLTVEDRSQPLRMPKMDALPEGGAFMAALAVRLDEEDEPRLRAEEVYLVVGRGYLVTVRDGPLGEVEERFRSQILAAQTWLESPGFPLAHAALDALVDGHAPVMVRTAADLEESLDPGTSGLR
jgi:Mg2+ and Co2+ transporter CorA